MENNYKKCDCCEDMAEYEYKNKYYCFDCLKELFNVKSYTETYYYIDDRYLGSDVDGYEVIENMNKEKKFLE